MSLGNRRVAVTGVGMLCALGHDRPRAWRSACEGASAIGPLTLVATEELRFTNGAEVRDFDPTRALDKADVHRLDRFAQFMQVAALEALADAGVTFDDELRRRTAVVTGTAMGGQNAMEEVYRKLYRENRSRLHPMSIPRYMLHSPASNLSMTFGLTGPAYTVSTACSSASHAIGQAFWMVRNGMVDLAITGGSEAPFCWGNVKAWESLRVVSPDTCRPFSKDRAGMILGEGAGALVLEPMEAARRRGAKMRAELAGFGMSSDAHHLTDPSVEGAARAMQEALRDGRLNHEDVDYVNAHGSGTLANDPAETAAIRQAFGEHASVLAVSSTKSMHGHALGGAGALEAALTVMAIDEGVIPPTANFNEPDPECDLDVVPNEARPAPIRAALSNSFSFGGLNAVLAFRRAEG